MRNGFKLKTTLALAVISAGLGAVPAQAVEIAFSGGSNTSNLNTVIGTDGLGDTWQTHNGSLSSNSNFAMADFNATPQTFNPSNFGNGLGTYATSFQLTANNSPFAGGLKGIDLGPVSSGLTNQFIVMPVLADPDTWIAWDATYNLMDPVTGLFQQVLFTAPVGTQLSQGTNFDTNVNFSGIFAAGSGWAASFDDRALLSLPPSTVSEPGSISLDRAVLSLLPNAVSEPGSIYLVGLGLLGLVAGYRRKPS